MTTRIEDELRELFEDRADQFYMDRSMPRNIARRARRRGIRAIAVVAVLALAAGSASVAALRVHGRGGPTRASAHPPGTGHTEKTVLKLVDYAPADGQDSPDDPSFESAFQQHVQCMRDHGFDVPDPTKTDNGWSII